MATETISQLPVALTANPATDYLELSQYSSSPGTTYVSKRITPAALVAAAAIYPLTVASSIEWVASNVNGPLDTGLTGYLIAPFSGFITQATLLSNRTGTIQLNIWQCSNSQFDAGVTHPVASDSICSATPPKITSGVKYSDSALTGWQLLFNTGDVFAFNIDNTSGTISQVTLSLQVTKTGA